MKVAIINQHKNEVYGGSEIQCDIIAQKLLEFGHEIAYIAINGTGNYSLPYRAIPVKQKSEEVVRIVIKEKPDIVYWRFNKKLFLQTTRTLNKVGIPVIFATAHENDILSWIRWNPIKVDKYIFLKSSLWLIKAVKYRWQHLGFKLVDGLIVNNIDHLNVLPIKKQAYIPNSNTRICELFQWPRPFICWVANLKPRKRPEICIDVATKIDKGVDLLMIGEIKDPVYSWFADKDKLPPNLHYLGPKTVPEVNGILAKSECLVHTCYPEGFPGNFIQAWLQGRPVVSYEIDPGGLIRSEKMGFVSGADLNRFVFDICNLINDRELNRSMGENALNYALRNFDSVKNVRMLEKFMLEIIRN